MDPFLQNHQYNRLSQLALRLLHAVQTSSDRSVVEAARHSAWSQAVEACPGLAGYRLEIVERIVRLQTAEDYVSYLRELSNYTVRFPKVTEKELKGLFPKVKKLRLPDLAGIEERMLTYLGWTDPGTERMYIVYPAEGKLLGIEGQFSPEAKRGICAFCNKGGETALFTAVSQKRSAHNPDYYKAVGQYICLDSVACNSRMTDIQAFERFVNDVAK